jgi:hypothetical protein
MVHNLTDVSTAGSQRLQRKQPLTAACRFIHGLSEAELTIDANFTRSDFQFSWCACGHDGGGQIGEEENLLDFKYWHADRSALFFDVRLKAYHLSSLLYVDGHDRSF